MSEVITCKMLFIEDYFESFVSSWGALAKPQPHEEGFVMPLGWEDGLATLNHLELNIQKNDCQTLP